MNMELISQQAGLIDFGNSKHATFDISFERARRSEFEVFGPLGRVKCPTVWQPEDKQAKIIIDTRKLWFDSRSCPSSQSLYFRDKSF